jgi:hypothetical protein
MWEFGSLVTVTDSTTRNHKHTTVTKTCASIGIAVFTSNENSYTVCIFSKNVTSNHPPRDVINNSIVTEWLSMETVNRGEMCQIILLNLLKTFNPDVCNNKNCITSLSITKCVASTFKTG